MNSLKKEVVGFKKITFSINQTKHMINVKKCKSILSKFRGLMFNPNSTNILFIFKKNQKKSIFFPNPLDKYPPFVVKSNCWDGVVSQGHFSTLLVL